MENSLNFLPEFLLFGSIVYFYLSILIFISILFWADIRENGFFALFAFLVFMVGMNYYSTFEPFRYITWTSVGLYLGVGFIHSIIRTYFYGASNPLKYNGYEHNPSEETVKKSIDDQIETKRSYLKGNVFRWWFLFPISFINWAISDLVRDVYNFVYSKLQSLYEGVFNMGIKRPDDKPLDRM